MLKFVVDPAAYTPLPSSTACANLENFRMLSPWLDFRGGIIGREAEFCLIIVCLA